MAEFAFYGGGPRAIIALAKTIGTCARKHSVHVLATSGFHWTERDRSRPYCIHFEVTGSKRKIAAFLDELVAPEGWTFRSCPGTVASHTKPDAEFNAEYIPILNENIHRWMHGVD